MIEVFKTNVRSSSEAKTLIAILLQLYPGSKINFDLHDCDNILRIEGNDFISEDIAAVLYNYGYKCKILE